MVRIRLIIFVLLLGLLLPWRVSAQDRALHWERYDYDILLLENGDLRFTETQTLVIDRGSFSFGTLSFDTGEYGRVRNVTVSEDGEQYRRSADQAGTFAASDDGQQFNLTYVFRDPNARRHTMVIGYTVGRALVAQDDRASLTWDFFCGSDGCPQINAGTITLRFPQTLDASSLDLNTSGAQVRALATGEQSRWELTEPIQGSQTRIGVTFPRSVLASTATFRSGADSPGIQPPRSQPQQPQTQPGVPGGTNSLPISPAFCVIILFVLFFLFSTTRRSARRRGFAPPRPRMPGPFGGFGGGFGMPRSRRRGWGIPPIIIAPPSQRRDDYGGPFSAPPDTSSGGGGSAWGDSGGGGSSWGDSGGGGSSWGDSGGGGSSRGDSGGGGSSSDSGGGGGNNNSRFG